MSGTDLHLSNPFAALEVRKAKKKKAVDADKRKRGAAKAEQQLRLEQEIFAKRQPNVSDWADDDDDEWGGHPASHVMADATNGKGPDSELHESEEEIDLEEHFGFELRKEDDHEEHEEKEKQETSAEPSTEELALLEEHRKRFHAQPQRKVSKKELKKKEMEDLDGLLADLGIDVNEEQKTSESSQKKKKKKTKDKSGGGGSVGGAGGEEGVEAAIGAVATQTTPPEQQQEQPPQQPEEEQPDQEEQEETQSSSLTPEQIRSKLEKTKSGKKRTTSKKSIEIAAAEAKARSKGKKGKKDATHYNQAPTH